MEYATAHGSATLNRILQQGQAQAAAAKATKPKKSEVVGELLFAVLCYTSLLTDNIVDHHSRPD